MRITKKSLSKTSSFGTLPQAHLALDKKRKGSLKITVSN